jgi:hypothetical protein
MFLLWFTFLGGSLVFSDVSPSILFFVFPLFGCFYLFMIRRVSSKACSNLANVYLKWSCTKFSPHLDKHSTSSLNLICL